MREDDVYRKAILRYNSIGMNNEAKHGGTEMKARDLVAVDAYEGLAKDSQKEQLRDMWATMYFENHPCKHMVDPDDMAEEAYSYADSMWRVREEQHGV